MLHQSSWRASATHNGELGRKAFKLYTALNHLEQKILDGVSTEHKIHSRTALTEPLDNELVTSTLPSMPERKEPPVKSMLKNKTMMNKHLKRESLTGMSVVGPYYGSFISRVARSRVFAWMAFTAGPYKFSPLL